MQRKIIGLVMIILVIVLACFAISRINDDVDNAADRIMAIIRAEHAKTERSIHKYMELLEVDYE